MKKGFLSLALAGILHLSCGASHSQPPSSVPPSSVPPSPPFHAETLVPETPQQQEQEEQEEKLPENFEHQAPGDSFKKSLDIAQNMARDIMPRQEKELGISYEGVEFFLQVCTPDMIPLDGKLPNADLYVAAIYLPEKNTLCLHPGLLIGLSPHPDNENFQQLLRTLSHELGHVYTDYRSEQLGKGDWPKYDPFQELIERWSVLAAGASTSQFEDLLSARNTLFQFQERYRTELTDFFLYKMVAEGIGEYFKGRGKKPDFIKDHALPRDISELLPLESVAWAYPLGYHVVKPIIDAFGAEGIDYLITHQPHSTGNLYEDVLRYKEQAMEELEK